MKTKKVIATKGKADTVTHLKLQSESSQELIDRWNEIPLDDRVKLLLSQPMQKVPKPIIPEIEIDEWSNSGHEFIGITLNRFLDEYLELLVDDFRNLLYDYYHRR